MFRPSLLRQVAAAAPTVLQSTTTTTTSVTKSAVPSLVRFATFATRPAQSPDAPPRRLSRRKDNVANRLSPPPPPSPEPRRARPYIITKTSSNEFPIYHLAKRGGNKKLTTIKKVEGDAQVFKRWLAEDLQISLDSIRVKTPTGHVEVDVRHSPPTINHKPSSSSLPNSHSNIHSGIYITINMD